MKRTKSVMFIICFGAISSSYASDTPTALSPSGTINTNQPDFKWTAVPGAQHYAVYARDATGELKVWQVVRASSADCTSGAGTCTYTHPGVEFSEGSGGFWKVMTTDNGYGPESNMLSFTVDGDISTDELALKSPKDEASVDTSTTAFEWDALKGAAPANAKSWSYTIKIIDTTTDETIAFQSLSPTNNCSNGQCSYSKPLVDGNYKWQVGVYESYDDGSYAYLLETDYSNFSVETESVNSELKIIAESKGGWDGASLDDVKTIALYTGNILLKRYFPGLNLDPVILRNRTAGGPKILHNRGDNNEYIIDLNVNGAFLNQFAYQFSHELTHAIGNYGETPNDANQWFEEVFSEAASLLTLKNIAEIWKIAPAFPEREYDASLFEEYYLEVINRETRQLQQGETLAEWYLREGTALRTTKIGHGSEIREKIGVVANRVFTFFNESPDRWESIKYLNIGDIGADIPLEEYLEVWKTQLPSDKKYIAETISSWFGY